MSDKLERDLIRDYTQGWDAVEPGTEQYYDRDADFCIEVAMEKCVEWEYAGDEHNYCHERSVLVGLVHEVFRLRGLVADDAP